MFNKPTIILSKLFFQYLIVALISFLISSVFIKNEKNIFLNLNPENVYEEMNTLLEEYFKVDKIKEKKVILKKIKKKGSLIYPLLFNGLNNDSAHKTEYIEIIDYLNLINNCPLYNTDCYKEKWNGLKGIYSENYIKNLLNEWMLYPEKRKSIEEDLRKSGNFATPYLLNFLVLHERIRYKNSKDLYILLSEISKEGNFKKEDFLYEKTVKEYFRYFYYLNKYYYQKPTFFNKIKTIFTNTEFANWMYSVFSLNFGTDNKVSIYEKVKIRVLRTLTIMISVLIVSYIVIIYLILIFKRKSGIFYKTFDKFIHILSVIPPGISVIFFFLISNSFNISGIGKLLQYIVLLMVITVLVIFRSMESIIIKEKEKDEIKAVRFFIRDEKFIFKKYIYKNINMILLLKIKTLIIPLVSYVIIIEYFLGFKGIGNFFMESLSFNNKIYLRVAVFMIGLMIIILKFFADFIVYLNKKEIYLYDTDN